MENNILDQGGSRRAFFFFILFTAMLYLEKKLMMKKSLLLFLVFSVVICKVCAQEVNIAPGMKISAGVKVKKNRYFLEAPADTAACLLIIEGNDMVVDFNGAELQGASADKRPDEFSGIAILIRNSRNVTVKNLVVKGYKVAIIARSSVQLTLENCDLSYNFRQRLNSTQEKEDISDWMSYHHNEQDEWLRYGAAMYFKDCSFFIIKNCRVTGGQNALMMMRCTDGLVTQNDFSFNSGIGIGMYRSSRNIVQNNRIIFNVRGYSHGVYQRGQDSAGILVYEQSHSNHFLSNNVTHGGDGFFLWAGQTTMDSGTGGCNDNILSGNDFSYAPTNGIEVTFSSNYISQNRIVECDHGIWGGYSYQTTIRENQFAGNRIAIAIEHGQRNLVEENSFSRDKTAIRIWANKSQPADWGYPARRDTRSVAYHIRRNKFQQHEEVFNIRRTDSVWVHQNSMTPGSGKVMNIDSTVVRLDSAFEFFTTGSSVRPIKQNKNSGWAFKGSEKYRGRKEIRITEWGPYDFRYPIIWQTNPTDTASVMKFEILGSGGSWQLKSSRGIKNISAVSGVFPALITAEKNSSGRADILLELEYSGSAFITQFGEKISAGKPHVFRFRKFFQPVNWEVSFYALDTAIHNPIQTGRLFSLHEKKAPVKEEKKNRLDYAWWGGIKTADNRYPGFITMASGTAEIPAGTYELSVTWDDAVRVYVDEKLVLDEWQPALYKFDESPNKKVKLILGGRHQFRVEHIELGGFATLSLKINPVD